MAARGASTSIRTRIVLAAVVESIALAIWVGSMTAFAFIFAPAAFVTIKDLDLFRRLVETTLGSINVTGFACGVIILAMQIVAGGPPRRLRAGCIMLMLVASGIEAYVIMPAMHALLAGIGGSIAGLHPGDPVRAAYDAEHRRSSLVYGVALIAGYVAIGLRAYDAFGTANTARHPLPG